MPRHRCRFVLWTIVVLLPMAVAGSAQAHDKARSARHHSAHHISIQCPHSARKGHHRLRQRIREDCSARVGWHHRRSAQPADVLLPSVSGSAVMGQTLSASTGSWTGATPIRYAYQWQQDGADISGATASIYVPTSSDVGHQLDVVVKASNSAGSSSAISPPTGIVSAPATEIPLTTPEPTPLPPSEPSPVPKESSESGPASKESSPPSESSSPSEPASSPEGAQVNAAPTGPPVPASGWHVAFADAFGAKLGYGPGQDSFWFLNKEEPANTYQSGLNSNELQVFNSSADRTGPEGLQILETYTPNAGGTGKNYVGGLVTTADHASGQHPFSWKSGGATTWAFECVCKWPYNTGEADPGWWSDATVNGQENEIDFFEGFGWGNTWHSVKEWSAAMPTVVGMNYDTVYGIEKLLGFDPTTGFHRYTTTLAPNGSKTVVSEYVDGILRSTYEIEYPANRKTFTHLILSYALREYPENFKAGTRSFDIRSVAVYQDNAHAGEEIQGGGIAPGTTIK